MSYYRDKASIIKDIFGASEVLVLENSIVVDTQELKVVNDVICFDPAEQNLILQESKEPVEYDASDEERVRKTFSIQWNKFSEVLEDHEAEFDQYFDLIDLSKLIGKRICDLGCGNGRWSSILLKKEPGIREIILVDFSDSIFIARENLKDYENAIFIKTSILNLPFRNDFADFIFCLGVLHHLPVNSLTVARQLSVYSPTMLFYLYYSLDNRPFYFKILFKIMNLIRKIFSNVNNKTIRDVFCYTFTYFVYWPFIHFGRIASKIGYSKAVPLYEFYHGKSMYRIRQDVYDRFFTSIEQRFSAAEIREMEDTFSEIYVSQNLPYWHFICHR